MHIVFFFLLSCVALANRDVNAASKAKDDLTQPHKLSDVLAAKKARIEAVKKSLSDARARAEEKRKLATEAKARASAARKMEANTLKKADEARTDVIHTKALELKKAKGIGDKIEKKATVVAGTASEEWDKVDVMKKTLDDAKANAATQGSTVEVSGERTSVEQIKADATKEALVELEQESSEAKKNAEAKVVVLTRQVEDARAMAEAATIFSEEGEEEVTRLSNEVVKFDAEKKLREQGMLKETMETQTSEELAEERARANAAELRVHSAASWTMFEEAKKSLLSVLEEAKVLKDPKALAAQAAEEKEDPQVLGTVLAKRLADEWGKFTAAKKPFEEAEAKAADEMRKATENKARAAAAKKEAVIKRETQEIEEKAKFTALTQAFEDSKAKALSSKAHSQESWDKLKTVTNALKEAQATAAMEDAMTEEPTERKQHALMLLQPQAAAVSDEGPLEVEESKEEPAPTAEERVHARMEEVAQKESAVEELSEDDYWSQKESAEKVVHNAEPTGAALYSMSKAEEAASEETKLIAAAKERVQEKMDSLTESKPKSQKTTKLKKKAKAKKNKAGKDENSIMGLFKGMLR